MVPATILLSDARRAIRRLTRALTTCVVRPSTASSPRTGASSFSQGQNHHRQRAHPLHSQTQQHRSRRHNQRSDRHLHSLRRARRASSPNSSSEVVGGLQTNDDPSFLHQNHNQILNHNHNHNVHAAVPRPPLICSRRRLRALVRSARVPHAEAFELYADGWTCCICLDDPILIPDSAPNQTSSVTAPPSSSASEQCSASSPASVCASLPAIARLSCGHMTHAHCLQTWLEKGRAVCCLCNADAFPPSGGKIGGEDDDENDDDVGHHSAASSSSTIDAPANSSLVAVRTDHTPSSPATSILIDVRPTSFDSPVRSDDRSVDAV